MNTPARARLRPCYPLGNAEAWLYQERARELRPSRRAAFLRGFVHGEEPGRYVLLSVKEEDISLDDR